MEATFLRLRALLPTAPPPVLPCQPPIHHLTGPGLKPVHSLRAPLGQRHIHASSASHPRFLSVRPCAVRCPDGGVAAPWLTQKRRDMFLFLGGEIPPTSSSRGSSRSVGNASLHSFFCFCFCLVWFGLFAFSGAAPAAYGGSQARGLIGTVATSLCQSHSNAGSEPHL